MSLKMARQSLLAGSHRAAIGGYIDYLQNAVNVYQRSGGEYGPFLREKLIQEGKAMSFEAYLEKYRKDKNFDKEALRPKPAIVMPLKEAMDHMVKTSLINALAEIGRTKHATEKRLAEEIAELNEIAALAELGLDEGGWA